MVLQLLGAAITSTQDLGQSVSYTAINLYFLTLPSRLQ